jgi:formylglycine-generating enzyme required for sulfatase activity/energy-coupling factor transporter ATP-binding protein EcfA2
VVRQSITVPWRVSRVQVLGTLEIYVVDGEDTEPIEERRLDLATVRGFGAMARAACIALVMAGSRGCSKQELDRAMSPPGNNPAWVRRNSIYSHVSAVRRSGLRIEFDTGRYRVDDLRLEQVDGLVFRDLRERVRSLEVGPQNEAARAEILRLCREAFELWTEDPAEAHPYLYDKAIFATDRRRYAAMKAAQARALLAAPRLDTAALAEATDAIEELRRVDPHASDLADLTHRLSGRSFALSATGDTVRDSPPRQRVKPAWLTRYRQYLLDFVESIDLRPFGSEVLSHSSLATVYTPLYVKPRSSEQPGPARQREAGRPTLEAVVNDARGLLVVGESGSGKSTFLQHLCREYLKARSGVVPLFLELGLLSDLSERDLDARGRLSPDVILHTFVSHLADEGISATVESMDAVAAGGQAIWLLDGLNEIPVPEVRAGVADAISACCRRWPASRFVVTTTDGALAVHGVPRGLERVDIDDFQPSDVEAFFEAFAADFYRDLGEQERRDRWQPLAGRVLSERDLRDLSRRPLHLAAIAVIYFTEGWLPESRADLLKAAINWWTSKRAPILRSFVHRARDLDLVFQELALRMLVAAKRPLSRVGKRWASEQIAKLPAFDGDVERGAAFLDAAVATGGLLMPRGPGDIGMHEAFRDYLAARHIAARTDDEASGWWSVLEPHLDDPEWRHVLTLVPGCLLVLGSDRADMYFDRLGRSCSGQPQDVRTARIALGGSVLRELMLAGYRLGAVPHWRDAVASVKELFYVPSDLEIGIRYQAAVAYGLTGDDRLADFDGAWVWLDGGEFWMGAQADDPDERNYDRDAAPWEAPVRIVTVLPFAIRRYPVTVQEYQEFVDEGGYEDASARWWTPEARDWREQEQVRAPSDWQDQLLVPNVPVTGVSWFECGAYSQWLSERAPGDVAYRLPFEHEWEYAARRGVEPGRQFRWGDRMQAGPLAEANWAGSYLRRKSPIGLFPRSTTPDGIADLFGNVEEWCLDDWQDGRTGGRLTFTLDPRGGMVKRVVRGGSCVRFSRLCRPTYRSRILQDRRYLTVGFRLVRPAALGSPPTVPSATGSGELRGPVPGA